MAPLLSMLSGQRKVCEWIDARDVLIVPEGPLSGLGEKGTAIDAWRTDKLQCVWFCVVGISCEPSNGWLVVWVWFPWITLWNWIVTRGHPWNPKAPTPTQTTNLPCFPFCCFRLVLFNFGNVFCGGGTGGTKTNTYMVFHGISSCFFFTAGWGSVNCRCVFPWPFYTETEFLEVAQKS